MNSLGYDGFYLTLPHKVGRLTTWTKTTAFKVLLTNLIPLMLFPLPEILTQPVNTNASHGIVFTKQNGSSESPSDFGGYECDLLRQKARLLTCKHG